MNNKEEKSKLNRTLNAVASLAVLGSVTYIFVVGVDLVSGLILLSAVGGIAGPPIASGEGLIDTVTSIFEAFIEGVQAALSTLTDAIGSLFG